MSEEEKKAIKELKHYINMIPYWRKQEEYTNIEIDNYIKKVLNLIDKQQKEIKKEKSRIMELDELLDKQENEIKFLKGELEIQEGCSISKDKIRETIEHYNNELEHIKNGEEFENEKPMYYWGKAALENLLEDN